MERRVSPPFGFVVPPCQKEEEKKAYCKKKKNSRSIVGKMEAKELGRAG